MNIFYICFEGDITQERERFINAKTSARGTHRCTIKDKNVAKRKCSGVFNCYSNKLHFEIKV